ncbi:ester cyclase [Chloroflexi bacterium TSY]|nr:ester cyclase [Chloroflexi bacterium TSY]
MSEANKAITRRYFEEVWNQGNLTVIPDLIAANHVHYDPATPDTDGPDGMEQLVTTFRAAFPDLHFNLEDQVAESNKVVTRWRVDGTHQGELMGIAPTNKTIAITGIDIHYILNDQIKEHWSNWDTGGLMRQLGAGPPTAE